MANFSALLSIDFKVCRLITETFSDGDNRVFLLFFRASEARTRKYCDSGYKQPRLGLQESCSRQFCHEAATVRENEQIS